MEEAVQHEEQPSKAASIFTTGPLHVIVSLIVPVVAFFGAALEFYLHARH